MTNHSTQNDKSNNKTREWIAEAVKNLQQLDPMHELLKYATGENPAEFENEARVRFNPNNDKDVDIAVEYLAALEDAVIELREKKTNDTLLLTNEVTDA